MSDAPILVVAGRPGSGKGTQSSMLAEALSLPIVDVGQRMRAERSRAGTRGDLLRSVAPGAYAPHRVAEAIFVEALEEARTNSEGMILDGYPRFGWQVDRLDQLLESRMVHGVIHLEVDVETAATRLSARVSCDRCGRTAPRQRNSPMARCPICDGSLVRRADDDIHALRARLATYENEAIGILNQYERRGILHRVDGIGDEEVVNHRIAARLDGVRLAKVKPPSADGQIALFGEL